jgi:hypothetical protein
MLFVELNDNSVTAWELENEMDRRRTGTMNALIASTTQLEHSGARSPWSGALKAEGLHALRAVHGVASTALAGLALRTAPHVWSVTFCENARITTRPVGPHGRPSQHTQSLEAMTRALPTTQAIAVWAIPAPDGNPAWCRVVPQFPMRPHPLTPNSIVPPMSNQLLQMLTDPCWYEDMPDPTPLPLYTILPPTTKHISFPS